MGGSQSTRKIGIENNEVVGVIRVSENVAQRLKNSTVVGSSSNKEPKTDSHSSVNTSAPAPAVMSQQQYAGGYVPSTLFTSAMVRQEVQKELEQNDRYWESHIRHLQDNQERISTILKEEFNTAYKEVESKFPALGLVPKSSSLPCQDYKSLVVDCFKNNVNQTLKCNKIVNEFTSCINNSRPRVSSGNRSP